MPAVTSLSPSTLHCRLVYTTIRLRSTVNPKLVIASTVDNDLWLSLRFCHPTPLSPLSSMQSEYIDKLPPFGNLVCLLSRARRYIGCFFFFSQGCRAVVEAQAITEGVTFCPGKEKSTFSSFVPILSSLARCRQITDRVYNLRLFTGHMRLQQENAVRHTFI